MSTYLMFPCLLLFFAAIDRKVWFKGMQTRYGKLTFENSGDGAREYTDRTIYLPELFPDICLPFVFVFFSLSQLLPPLHLQPLPMPAPLPVPPHLPPLPLPPPHLPLHLLPLPLPPCLHNLPQTLIQRTNLSSQDPLVNREFVAPLLHLSASPLQQPGGSLGEAPVPSQSSWTGCVNRVTTVPRFLETLDIHGGPDQ